VIQHKLFLPEFAKLLFVKNAGSLAAYFRSVSMLGPGFLMERPRNASDQAGITSAQKGEGVALDMMAHWRYMIDRLASPVTAVCALMATAIPERADEQGRLYVVDVEDTSRALLLSGRAL
jgi:hypothetical protein